MNNKNSNFIELKGISKIFTSISGKDTIALNNISICLRKSELLSVVGPSGSGKTTLLNLIAGIELPTIGVIKFFNDNRKIKIGFVFQNNTIFPWRIVEKNLTYPLELKKISKVKRKEKAIDICKLIGMEPKIFLKKYPKELSGGEQRRVAIGMALAHDADLLLLDEPTSQLDYLNKWCIQNIIQDLWLKKRFTAVLVTHDIDEAIYLGDRVIILEQGQLKSAAQIEIDIPRPRNDLMRSSEIFNSYRKKITKFYREMNDEKNPA